jgi:hypothetical protein
VGADGVVQAAGAVRILIVLRVAPLSQHAGGVVADVVGRHDNDVASGLEAARPVHDR